jgi:hypothetical protein
MSVQCAYGIVGEILDFGITTHDDGNPDLQCSVNNNNAQCRPNSPVFIAKVNSFVG